METFFQLSRLPSFFASYLELELEAANLQESADGGSPSFGSGAPTEKSAFLMS
jgi:hypothetical protein